MKRFTKMLVLPAILCLLLFVSCNTTFSIFPEHTPPDGEVPVFDPLNPEEWEATPWFLAGELNAGKYVDLRTDGVVGDLYLRMTLDEAVSFFPSADYTKKDHVFGNGIDESTTYTFDHITLTFHNIGLFKKFVLTIIEVHGSEYATARGLRVGDAAEKVFELYGIPVNVRSGEWNYNEERSYLSTVNITVVEGVVDTIRIWRM